MFGDPTPGVRADARWPDLGQIRDIELAYPHHQGRCEAIGHMEHSSRDIDDLGTRTRGVREIEMRRADIDTVSGSAEGNRPATDGNRPVGDADEASAHRHLGLHAAWLECGIERHGHCQRHGKVACRQSGHDRRGPYRRYADGQFAT